MEMSEVVEYLEGWILKAQNAVNALRSLESTEPNAQKPVSPEAAPKPKRQYRYKDKPDTTAYAASKVCNGCRKSKPLEEYPKHEQCCGGHSGTCKSCIAAKSREKYKAKSGSTKSGPLPFSCEECNAKFSSREALDGHMEDRHS